MNYNESIAKIADYLKELEQENKELKAHVNKAHEIIDDVASADTRKEACRIACELIDSTPKQSLAQHDREVAVKAIESLKLSPKSKAGCIGEFDIEVEQICPQCFEEYSVDCDMCNGESDEAGRSTYFKPVPWDTQKEIFKRMLSNAKEYAIEQLKEGE
jgi:hypothetical protein